MSEDATVFFKAKIDGKEYVLDRLTLGEAHILKHEFDLADVEMVDAGDPDHIRGLIYLAFRRGDRRASHADLIARVDDVSYDDIQSVGTDADPTGADEAPKKPGGSAKTRKNSGSRG